MNNGKLTGVLYVYLSKAFDIIGHIVLLQKFSTYGEKDSKFDRVRWRTPSPKRIWKL